MISQMKAIPENMKSAAQKGFINATDLADYLTKKGMPFRTAYKISGSIVAYCIKEGYVLETLPLEKYREFDKMFDADVYKAVDLNECVEKRRSYGATSVSNVENQIEIVRKAIK